MSLCSRRSPRETLDTHLVPLPNPPGQRPRPYAGVSEIVTVLDSEVEQTIGIPSYFAMKRKSRIEYIFT